MVSTNPQVPILSYGEIPASEDFEIPVELEAPDEDPVEVFQIIELGILIRQWIMNDPKQRGSVFFGSVLDSFHHAPTPSQLIALRFLLMAQFFMRHPTVERSSRGE